MLRKMILAALAVAAVGLLAPQAAQAGGGHGHWGGGGGFHGGGWGHGWHGGGFWPGVAIGAGIAGAGYYGGYYGYGYPYSGDPYYDGAGYGDGGYDGQCYLVRKRVMTQWGWRIRRAQVCE
jgi:hypothetical protein